MNKYKLNQNIRRAFFIYVLLFVILFLYVANFLFFEKDKHINNNLNPRVYLKNEDFERGDFYSSDGVLLTNRNERPQLLYDDVYWHIVGNVKNPSTNLEEKLGLKLLEADDMFIQSYENDISDKKIKGNSFQLSINHELQIYINNMLENKNGSITVLEPETNKVVAMDSSPSTYNIQEYEDVVDDVFINKNTTRLYKSIDINKLLTKISFIQNNENYINEAVSKNELVKTLDSFLFDELLHTPLNISKPLINEMGEVEMTPIHMALILSSIVNNGDLLQPQILDYKLNYKKEVIKKYVKKFHSKPFDTIVAEDLKNSLLINKDGYSTITLNFKTVDDENISDVFVGYFNDDKKSLIMTIVYEDIAKEYDLYNDAKKIFEFYKKQ